MALEALRDVFIQAGQSYANRARQDELLAQERARQDELLAQERARQDVIYTRQRTDTEKDMDRRNTEQKDAENRAELKRIDAENRALVNQVRSGGAEAQRKMRSEYAGITGDSSVLNVNTDGSYAVKDTEFADKYEKGLSDGKDKRELEEAMRRLKVAEKTYDAFQKQDDKAKARSRQAVVSGINQINEELAAVERELNRSHADMTTRITAGRNKLAKEAVEKIAGPAGSEVRARYMAANKNRLKGDESDFSILFNSGSLAEVQALQEAYVKAEGSRDPGANALLQKQSSLLKRSTDAHDFARKIEANLTPGSRGQWSAGYSDLGAAPGNTSYFTSQTPEAKDENPLATTPPPSGGVPSIEAVTGALNAALGKGGAQTKVEAPTSTATPDPFLGLDGGDPRLNGGDPSTFFVPPGAPAPAPAAPTAAAATPSEAPAAPTAAAATPSEAPAWWSRDRDPAANQRAVIEFAKNAPGKVIDPIYDAARTLASKVNPNNFVRGSQVPVYDPVTGKEGVDAVYAYDPKTAADIRRMNDERTTTPVEFFTSGDLTRKIGTKLPDITSSGGPTSPNTFFANQDPLLFNQSFSPKPMTFGESFAKRYAEVQNSNMTPREKAESLAAIVRTRDLLVSRGLTYDSPDPVQSSIKRAGSLSGTVYSGPRSKAPGWAQGAVTVPPQTFPGFFGPTAR